MHRSLLTKRQSMQRQLQIQSSPQLQLQQRRKEKLQLRRMSRTLTRRSMRQISTLSQRHSPEVATPLTRSSGSARQPPSKYLPLCMSSLSLWRRLKQTWRVCSGNTACLWSLPHMTSAKRLPGQALCQLISLLARLGIQILRRVENFETTKRCQTCAIKCLYSNFAICCVT